MISLFKDILIEDIYFKYILKEDISFKDKSLKISLLNIYSKKISLFKDK